MDNSRFKFRAWDKDNGVMIYSESDGDEYVWHIGKDGIMVLAHDNDGELDYYPEIQDATIMQFTGLLDKNGKEIYEGDIVKVPVDSPYISTHGEYAIKEIIYRNGAWIASYISSKAKLPRGYIAGELTNSRLSENDEYCLYDDKSYCIINCEIIGNIFDNPSLD